VGVIRSRLNMYDISKSDLVYVSCVSERNLRPSSAKVIPHSSFVPHTNALAPWVPLGPMEASHTPDVSISRMDQEYNFHYLNDPFVNFTKLLTHQSQLSLPIRMFLIAEWKVKC